LRRKNLKDEVRMKSCFKRNSPQGLQEGRKEGRKKGRKEGRKEGRIKLIWHPPHCP
jgi:flagellar biosynthesis/type III secretory pathway protein FliH